MGKGLEQPGEVLAGLDGPDREEIARERDAESAQRVVADRFGQHAGQAIAGRVGHDSNAIGIDGERGDDVGLGRLAVHEDGVSLAAGVRQREAHVARHLWQRM